MSGFRPASLENALDLLASRRLLPMAGGTDLMVSGRRGPGLSPAFSRPVLFIGHLDELKLLTVGEGGGTPSGGTPSGGTLSGDPAAGGAVRLLSVGSACTFATLIGRTEVPLHIKKVVSRIASPAIRNRGTIGGNVCNASPAGDTLPFLYALDAELDLVSARGLRTLPIREFITAPGETDRRQDELLARVLVPLPPFNVTFYRKVGMRKANACAKLSFFGLARIDGGIVEDIRIAFGAVAPTVVRSREIEKSMIGRRVQEVVDGAAKTADLYEPLLEPIDDPRSTAAYRKEVSLRLLAHFLGESLVFAP